MVTRHGVGMQAFRAPHFAHRSGVPAACMASRAATHVPGSLVFELRDDDAGITLILLARLVVSEHRSLSLTCCAVTPGLDLPVQDLVPEGEDW